MRPGSCTLFWLKLLQHYRESAGGRLAFPVLVRQALERLGNKQLLFAHYSRAVVFSDAARQGWVDLDLLPLPWPPPG